MKVRSFLLSLLLVSPLAHAGPVEDEFRRRLNKAEDSCQAQQTRQTEELRATLLHRLERRFSAKMTGYEKATPESSFAQFSNGLYCRLRFAGGPLGDQILLQLREADCLDGASKRAPAVELGEEFYATAKTCEL